MNMHRRLVAGALALGALLGMASPAAASEKVFEYRDNLEYVMSGWDNPCTPEFDDLRVTASGLVALTVWEAEDGTITGRSRLQVQLDAVVNDGTRYVGGTQSSSDSRVEARMSYFSSDNRHRMVSLGEAPDFHSRYKTQGAFNFDDFSFTFEIIKDEMDCRG